RLRASWPARRGRARRARSPRHSGEPASAFSAPERSPRTSRGRSGRAASRMSGPAPGGNASISWWPPRRRARPACSPTGAASRPRVCRFAGTLCIASPGVLRARPRRSAGGLYRGFRRSGLPTAEARLESLISPYVGIVSDVAEILRGADDGRFACFTARPASNSRLVGEAIEEGGGGRHLDRRRARSAALAEAAERYSASFVPAATVLASAASLGRAAVEPASFALFSD